MNSIIRLYYLFYILTGGFRHFSIEYEYFQAHSFKEYSIESNIFNYFEIILMIISFCSLFFPRKKYLHLLFFFLLLCIDLFFQNNVGYISSAILPHLFPLFFYLTNKYSRDKQSLSLLSFSGILFVSTGYIVGGYGKFLSGYYSFDDLVVYGFISRFNWGYDLPSWRPVVEFLLEFKNFIFWKAVDISILIFQLSFIINFFSTRYFYILSLFSLLFHIAVLLTLGIGIFFPYILFYTMILQQDLLIKTNNIIIPRRNFSEIVLLLLSLLLFLYFITLGSFDVHFFNQILPFELWLYSEYYYNLICVIAFVLSLIKVYSIKSKANKKQKHDTN